MVLYDKPKQKLPISLGGKYIQGGLPKQLTSN